MEAPKEKTPEQKRGFVEKYSQLVKENNGKEPSIVDLMDLLFATPEEKEAERQRIKREKRLDDAWNDLGNTLKEEV